MKYGINDAVEETTNEKRELRLESNEPSKRPIATVMANNKRDVDAVVFSIQFYGKTVGEVGMMDQDLAELDWKKFKSYLFQNLLTLNNQENICVRYSDEEGDKLPIESDEEYQEALKVAKKKAETNDKMILDITRQGGFPAVLSLVSSGIKKVGSSPPKDGSGISFFKAASSPKDASSFQSVGDKRVFQGLFMPDRGPIPGHAQGVWEIDCDEAFECGKFNIAPSTTTTTTTTTTASFVASSPDSKRATGPPVHGLRDYPPSMIFKLDGASGHSLDSSESFTSQNAFGGHYPYEETLSGARPKYLPPGRRLSNQPPEWFTSYMSKFREDICEDITSSVVTKITDILKNNVVTKPETEFSSLDCNTVTPSQPQSVTPTQAQQENIVEKCHRKYKGPKKSHASTDVEDPLLIVDVETVDEKDDSAQRLHKDLKNTVKVWSPGNRRKIGNEHDRLIKKQEKIERRKIVLTSKFADEMDKVSRTQEKVFAKMEGLRKKQSCSQEELSKLRKMVDKHQQRFLTSEQRQQRRNERKLGLHKSKSKKINIDNKGFPVDASLLHAALQELEALAEDSTSDGTGGTTRGYDARYLKDITFPDGSIVPPGTEFVKTWRVGNSGIMPWNEKTTLCKWSQVRFRGSPAGWKLKPSMKRVVCPPLEPGEEGDISVTFTAPNEPGWYATHWRFCQRGRVFGNQMWCAIHVVENASNCEASKEGLVDEKDLARLSVSKSDMLKISKAIMPEKNVKSPAFEKFKPKSCGSGNNKGEPFSQQELANPSEDTPKTVELGIVENYYDAEDPVEISAEINKSMQKLSLAVDEDNAEANLDKKENDLISFEDDAVMLSSGSSTPELLLNIPQATTHSVVPLKEMAKESVENLHVLIKEHQAKSQPPQENSKSVSKSVQIDAISISSGSFSELDSEDQAILNESDSDGSDNGYYVVRMPDCFDMTDLDDFPDLSPLTEGLPALEAKLKSERRAEAERPDTPDFLTADEDDRSTALNDSFSEYPDFPNFGLKKHPTEPSYPEYLKEEHNYAAARSHSPSSLRSIQMSNQDHTYAAVRPYPIEDQDHSDSCPSSPQTNNLARPETKASHKSSSIQTNICNSTTTMKTVQNNDKPLHIAASSQNSKQDDYEQHSNVAQCRVSNGSTWSNDTDNAHNVVCEQPYPAKHKDDSKQQQQQADGNHNDNANRNELTASNPANPLQLPDLVGALPDELVSMIPEDLVRGAWNTARSFITRINQEMMSPDNPGQVYTCKEEPSDNKEHQQPEQIPEQLSATTSTQQKEEPETDTNARAEGETTISPLPPPMQQLGDMGFHNREMNERLLTKYNGDVSCAVAELIILNCQ